MLMRPSPNGFTPRTHSRRERQLWHDPRKNAPALGCHGCPEKFLCGGICAAAPYFDCLTYCCANPSSCASVCRSAPEDFARRVWEVEGFGFGNLPSTPTLQPLELPQVIPIMFHGSCREEKAILEVVALPLCAMFNRRDGTARFTDAATLRLNFHLAHDTPILLTGTDEDAPLERWWQMETSRRVAVIRAMRNANVGMVTTPNYSLTTNVPRWDDLYAMKRIALVYTEFVGEGMPAALHVNGRTDTDFIRWTELIARRDEITHLTYEFTTGTGWPGRREQHATWLIKLAAEVGRPLHLIVRGGHGLLGKLATAFAGLTVLETESFMRTMKRRRAVPIGAGNLTWQANPTPPEASLDALFAANVGAMRAHLEWQMQKRAQPLGH